MPTASGKTWIQGLLAQYFISRGKKVTILEPNETLRKQTLSLIGNIDDNLSVNTIDWFYKYPSSEEIVIVNEYDYIV
jgi:reverse gyrase